MYIQYHITYIESHIGIGVRPKLLNVLETWVDSILCGLALLGAYDFEGNVDFDVNGVGVSDEEAYWFLSCVWSGNIDGQGGEVFIVSVNYIGVP